MLIPFKWYQRNIYNKWSEVIQGKQSAQMSQKQDEHNICYQDSI